MDHQTLLDHIKLLIAAVLGSIAAITLNEWVSITAIIYSVMQITLLMPKYFEAMKRRLAWIRVWWGKRAANDR